MISILFIIIFIITITFVFIINYILSKYNKNSLYEKYVSYTLDDYKDLMLKNNKEKLYKISLKNTKIRRENCFETCDKKNCIKLDDKKRLLDKCLKCNSQKNKCFKKSIIGGLCDDCSGEDEKNKIDCNNILNFGCIDPNNLNNNNGVEPYFIQIPDINVSSPFDKKCVFCWNINSEL